MIGLALMLMLAPAPDRAAAMAACQSEDPALAEHACSALIRQMSGPDLAIALTNRANARRHAAQRLLATARGEAEARRQLSLALADYDRALRLSPGLAEALVNRGIVWFEQGRLDRAVADASAAIALRPDLAEAWNNRCLALLRLGRAAEAQRDFDRTIRLHQNYGNALINREIAPVPFAGTGS